jgi:ABC-2 type transport system permease protein
VLTVAVSLSAGNIRSVYAPKLIDLGKFRQGRQGQINALIGLGVLVACLALGAGVLYLAHHVDRPWLAAPILAVFAAGAITFYRMNLNHLEAIALERRETISAELCRT